MGALSTYTVQTQRLLHDLSFQYWPQAELTDYINEARAKITEDSKCLRVTVPGITLTAQTELYVPQSILPAPYTAYYLDTYGITLYFGTLRYKLFEKAFTDFDATYRRYVSYYQRPVCFSRQGSTQVWFGPNPDQSYVTDWDIAICTTPLASDSDVEQLPIPYQSCVKYYAAHLAKFKEQAIGEAEIFEQKYMSRLRQAYRANRGRLMPNPYAIRQ